MFTGGTPEPASFRSLARHPERSQFESMARQRITLENRGSWEFVPLVPSVAIGSLRCTYFNRKKLLNDGKVQYYSRLVGCGYSQVAGVNHSSDEISAGVISIFFNSVYYVSDVPEKLHLKSSRHHHCSLFLKFFFRNKIYMESLSTCEGPIVAHSVTHKVVSSFADSSAVYMA